MAEEPLPPGVLPNITDTDPPPVNPGTIIGDGFVGAVPACMDTPHVTYDGTTLSCTMGNWIGEPSAYAYKWQLDGNDVTGADEPTYTPKGSDAGEVTCIVTASNDYGATAAPPSNAIAVGGSTRRAERSHERERERERDQHGRQERQERH